MMRMTAGHLASRLQEKRQDWCRIENHVGSGEADIYLYDEIGYWGTTAASFIAELSSLNVSAINVHLNSPGGEIFDGIAICNALRNHPAQVTAYVDSLAASIASVIAMGGDRIVMAPNSQLMIHDGSGLCLGNAADMREAAELLDRQSDNIAAIYAAKAGGTTAEWRARMIATTWYTAEEAVEAGLADEVSSTRTLTDGNSPRNLWEMSILGRASRSEAPAPHPVASAVECQPQPVVAPPTVEPEPAAPAAEPAAADGAEPAAAPPAEPEAPEATPEPVPASDPWAAATAHLYSAPSTDDVFTRLTEALL